MKHILIGYDATDHAEKAFDFALDLANKYQAQLTVLAVANISDRFLNFKEGEINLAPEPDIGDAVVLLIDRYNDGFAKLRKKADAFPFMTLHFKIVDGNPAQEIVHFAEQLEADHIVVGYRGESRFKRWLIGSVAKQVMIYAHCSISIIR